MKKSLIKSTGIVAASTLISRIMGFARDMIIAGIFGASAFLDGFWVAFRIPNLFRRLVAEGSLTISFVPVYTEYLVTKGEEEALALAQKTLSILLLVLLSIVSLGIIFSPEIISVFGYGFTDPGQISSTISLNRIMFPYLFFVGLVAFSMGYLNSHKYFFAPAFAPVLLNVGFITGALILKNYFENPLYGLALGVILGGIMQLILQIPYMIKTGFKIKISIDFKHPGIKAIFRMIAPALAGIAIYQVNILMSTVLASMLPAGSISYLYYSDRLTELVLGVFIVSLGNVILPELSGFSASSDFKKLRDLYSSSIRSALFIAVPAGIALMVIGFPIISVLFMRGEFSLYDTAMTYRALLYAAIGIAPVSIIRITVPAFYSRKDTRTPVIAAGISFIFNISLGYLLMQTSLKHAGLTLALSMAATVQMLVLLISIQKKIGAIDIRQIMASFMKNITAAAAMALVIWPISSGTDWAGDPLLSRILSLVITIIAGGATYFIACIILKSKEALFIKDMIIRKFVTIYQMKDK